jgi:MtN3 and saliva related transmembrane protein
MAPPPVPQRTAMPRPFLSIVAKAPSMPLSELIGYLAATLTTCSFVPQAWHTFRTRDVSGISLGMYSVFTTGVALWLAYGVALQAWPIVIANAITLVLASTILAMKLRFRDPPG